MSSKSEKGLFGDINVHDARGVPLISTGDARFRGLDCQTPDKLLAKISLRETLQDQIVMLGHSLRRSVTHPTDPLHVLLLLDNIPLPQIAGIMRADPADVATRLETLTQLGLVTATIEDGTERYSITGDGESMRG